ncbi:MAG: hypothetical protein MK160_07250 [Rhodobacteraceae bacterium]|nr:hypothetical protein [Paracoccaceae bacterium]
MTAAALEGCLLQAHEAGDKQALVSLYAQAADAANSIEAKAFFLTQAYVFALDCAHQDRAGLHSQLVAMGCEA